MCEHKSRARYESKNKQVCVDCGFEMPLHEVFKVSELAKLFCEHKSQVHGLIQRYKIKPVETRPNIYGGVTNFYRIEDFLNANR